MRHALIIGAGPAGLTAAFEFIHRSEIHPLVLEKSDYMGGISRTVRYHGNRMDIGGHRFFSKSDRVMNWWMRIMPVEPAASGVTHSIAYQGKNRDVTIPATESEALEDDRIMLIRSRKSRIYFLRQFFDYPIQLNAQTVKQLGLLRMMKIGLSYTASLLHQIKPEKTLEQFLINRFGKELYLTFFKSYTEKVWGVPCDQISAEWGAQRIKGLSITKAVGHFLKKTLAAKSPGDIAQKVLKRLSLRSSCIRNMGPVTFGSTSPTM